MDYTFRTRCPSTSRRPFPSDYQRYGRQIRLRYTRECSCALWRAPCGRVLMYL
jgi:hypothetical protein